MTPALKKRNFLLRGFKGVVLLFPPFRSQHSSEKSSFDFLDVRKRTTKDGGRETLMPIFSKSSGEYVGSQVRTSQVQTKTQNTEKKNVQVYMDVSKNRDTPKWMVYNGKPH